MVDDFLDNIYLTNRQNVVDLIIEYREELGEPNPSWPKADFENVTYSKWALDEIIQSLNNNLEWTPTRVVEEFKYSMSEGIAAYVRFPDIQRIFEIGYSAAVNVSERLYAMGI